MKLEKILELCEHLELDLDDLKEEDKKSLLKCSSRKEAEQFLRAKTPAIRSRITKQIQTIIGKTQNPDEITRRDIALFSNKAGRGDIKQMMEMFIHAYQGVNREKQELEDDIVQICGITIEALKEKVIEVKDLKETTNTMMKHLPKDKEAFQK